MGCGRGGPPADAEVQICYLYHQPSCSCLQRECTACVWQHQSSSGTPETTSCSSVERECTAYQKPQSFPYAIVQACCSCVERECSACVKIVIFSLCYCISLQLICAELARCLCRSTNLLLVLLYKPSCSCVERECTACAEVPVFSLCSYKRPAACELSLIAILL